LQLLLTTGMSLFLVGTYLLLIYILTLVKI
jgi:hypothetical protein